MSKDIRYYFSVKQSQPDIKHQDIKYQNTSITQTNPNISCKFEAFTDGSAINNGRKNVKAGIGVYFPDSSLGLDNIARNCNLFIKQNPQLKVDKSTNNVAELLAILLAIESLIPYIKTKDDSVVIYSDSEYSINCVTKWSLGWKRAGWKKKGKDKEIKNIEIIKLIFNYCEKFRVKFVHINSHKAEPFPKGSREWLSWYGNDYADKLAVQGAKSI